LTVPIGIDARLAPQNEESGTLKYLEISKCWRFHLNLQLGPIQNLKSLKLTSSSIKFPSPSSLPSPNAFPSILAIHDPLPFPALHPALGPGTKARAHNAMQLTPGTARKQRQQLTHHGCDG